MSPELTEDVKTPTEEAAPSPASAPDAPADSPPAEVVKPTSMLEAVEEALKKPTSDVVDSLEPSTQPETETPVGEPSKEKAPPEQVSIDPKDYAKEPFGKHPRFKAMLAEVKSSRETVAQQAEELTKLKADFTQAEATVQDYVNFRTEVQKANLGADEISSGFTIMAKMKNNPVEALPLLEAEVQKLKSYLGLSLTPDLQDRVDKGLVDNDTALLLSQERARLTHEATLAAQRATQVESAASAQQIQSVKTSVEAWEANWKKSDPDYTHLREFVLGEIQFQLSQRGFPPTPEVALQMAEQAKAVVTARLAKLRPVKKEITPIRPHMQPANTESAPKTMLEVVEREMRKAQSQY